MSFAFSTELRNAQASQLSTVIGSGGKVRIYSGTRPASGGAATTLLAENNLSATAGTATGGVFTFNAISDSTAVASGTPTWARIVKSTGTFVVDMDAGIGSGDLQIDEAIVAGGTVSVSSATITRGNA